MTLPPGARFHHIGVACRDLDAEARALAPLGYRREGPDFLDPGQGIEGRFLTGGGPRLELLRPAPAGLDRGLLGPWLQAGTKLYHLAYEVTSLDDAIAALRSGRARLVAGPTPAVAFALRPIAFVMLPTLILIELVQAATAGPEPGA